jgi:flagella basal body P-ring formation protein FlgA
MILVGALALQFGRAVPIAPLVALILLLLAALFFPRLIVGSCLVLSVACGWWLLQGHTSLGARTLGEVVSEIQVPVASRALLEGTVIDSRALISRRIVLAQVPAGSARRLDDVEGKLLLKSVPSGAMIPLDALDDWLEVPVLGCAMPARVRVVTDRRCPTGETIQRQKLPLRTLPADVLLRDDEVRDHLTLRPLPAGTPISAATLAAYQMRPVPRDTIPAGTIVTDAMVELRPVPVGQLDAQSVESMEEVVGGVAMVTLEKGQPMRRSILAGQLPDSGTQVAVAVPNHFIAAGSTFTIDDLSWELLPFPSLGNDTLVKTEDVVPVGQTATALVNLPPGVPIDRASVQR